jgi:hypothetical protein
MANFFVPLGESVDLSDDDRHARFRVYHPFPSPGHGGGIRHFETPGCGNVTRNQRSMKPVFTLGTLATFGGNSAGRPAHLIDVASAARLSASIGWRACACVIPVIFVEPGSILGKSRTPS